MILRKLSEAKPFITKDGSSIRSLLDLTNAPVEKQSLAEAEVPVGAKTGKHRHGEAEEIYFFTQGEGMMELDNETFRVSVGDTVLIPPGSGHSLENTGSSPLKLLCCCAPPYRHEDTELL